VIENLRNRQWSRHLAERTKAERIQMDEAALRFYLESRRAGRSLGET
jgi:flagellar biosynthesis chaperone FliJ